ncbi:MAG: hypothetical protein HW403_1183, partial [Dehalococcoidia bacterium]|nr:hypothetical protein [Dehalococcoidia bacterium]
MAIPGSNSISSAARVIAQRELWLLALATPLLMFPNKGTPLGLA